MYIRLILVNFSLHMLQSRYEEKQKMVAVKYCGRLPGLGIEVFAFASQIPSIRLDSITTQYILIFCQV
jgi:hypothetical protein